MDASAIRTWEIADALGHGMTRGQSPFAIVNGNRFEYLLKKGTNYELLVDALRPFIDFPEHDEISVEELGYVPGYKIGDPMLRARAEKTEKALAAIARGDTDAPDLMDHPVLCVDLAGTPVFLEPDGLACRVGQKLELVEIKSYAIIDEQAAPDKLAATAGQAAVYLLALRETLQRLEFNPDLAENSVILVALRNFGRTPTAHRIPLRKKLMALQRVFRAVPKTTSVLASLPAGFTLDVDPSGAMRAERRRRALDKAVQHLPMLYVPECLSSCDMAKYCRDQAIRDDDPARLGRTARDGLAGVPTLAAALELAEKGREGTEDPQLADIAESLQHARKAIQRARRIALLVGGGRAGKSPSKAKTSKAKTSKAKSTKAKSTKAKSTKAKSTKAKSTKAKTSKAKTSKAKTSKAKRAKAKARKGRKR